MILELKILWNEEHHDKLRDVPWCCWNQEQMAETAVELLVAVQGPEVFLEGVSWRRFGNLILYNESGNFPLLLSPHFFSFPFHSPRISKQLQIFLILLRVVSCPYQDFGTKIKCSIHHNHISNGNHCMSSTFGAATSSPYNFWSNHSISLIFGETTQFSQSLEQPLHLLNL